MTKEQKQALRAARSPQRNYTREEAYAQMDRMMERTRETGVHPGNIRTPTAFCPHSPGYVDRTALRFSENQPPLSFPPMKIKTLILFWMKSVTQVELSAICTNANHWIKKRKGSSHIPFRALRLNPLIFEETSFKLSRAGLELDGSCCPDGP